MRARGCARRRRHRGGGCNRGNQALGSINPDSSPTLRINPYPHSLPHRPFCPPGAPVLPPAASYRFRRAWRCCSRGNPPIQPSVHPDPDPDPDPSPPQSLPAFLASSLVLPARGSRAPSRCFLSLFGGPGDVATVGILLFGRSSLPTPDPPPRSLPAFPAPLSIPLARGSSTPSRRFPPLSGGPGGRCNHENLLIQSPIPSAPDRNPPHCSFTSTSFPLSTHHPSPAPSAWQLVPCDFFHAILVTLAAGRGLYRCRYHSTCWLGMGGLRLQVRFALLMTHCVHKTNNYTYPPASWPVDRSQGPSVVPTSILRLCFQPSSLLPSPALSALRNHFQIASLHAPLFHVPYTPISTSQLSDPLTSDPDPPL